MTRTHARVDVVLPRSEETSSSRSRLDARASSNASPSRSPKRERLAWLDNERRIALARAEHLRAKVLASRRLLNAELAKRSSARASGSQGRASDASEKRELARERSAREHIDVDDVERRDGNEREQRTNEHLDDSALRSVSVKERIEDVRRKLERATTGANAPPSSTSRSGTDFTSQRSGVERATKEDFQVIHVEDDDRDRDARQRTLMDEMKAKRASAEAALEEATSALRATREELARARDDEARAREIAKEREGMSEEAKGRAESAMAMVKAYENQLDEARARGERELRVKIDEMEELRRELERARGELERVKSSQRDAMNAQLAQQSTVQHNLVKELTDAKTEERAGRVKIKELESKLEVVTAALEEATNSIADAAKAQNAAISRSEREMISSFEAREAETKAAHEERERASKARVNELEAQIGEASKKIARLEREIKEALDAHAKAAKSEREATAMVDRLTDEVEAMKSALDRSRVEAETSSARTTEETAALAQKLNKRIAELEIELERSTAAYERNETEYQRLIEDVSAQNAALKAKATVSADSSAAFLRAQNEKLKIEVQALSQTLADIERGEDESSSGLFSIFASPSKSSTALAANKRRVKDLELELDVERAEHERVRSVLEQKLEACIAERDDLREKSNQTSFAALFGF